LRKVEAQGVQEKREAFLREKATVKRRRETTKKRRRKREKRTGGVDIGEAFPLVKRKGFWAKRKP